MATTRRLGLRRVPPDNPWEGTPDCAFKAASGDVVNMAASWAATGARI